MDSLEFTIELNVLLVAIPYKNGSWIIVTNYALSLLPSFGHPSHGTLMTGNCFAPGNLDKTAHSFLYSNEWKVINPLCKN